MLGVLVAFICAQHAIAAGAPRSFYGVMAADDPTSAEAAQMGAGRVGTLRINLVWAWVQPDSSTEYDWAHYDQVIGDAARNGIRALPTVYGSPSWAALKENYPPWQQDNVNAFRAFASAAAERYGASGTFWVDHPEIPKLPVIWWQLWNEVSSSNFWDRTPKPAEYVDLLRTFREGIREGDSSGKILLAGLFPEPLAPNSIPFKPYLRALYKDGAKPLFDGAALHPYGATPRVALQRVRAMRSLMSRYGDTNTPIWITEVGWADAGLPSPITVSPGEQGIYLVNTFQKLAAARKRLNIAGVVWFSFRDRRGQFWPDHTGLVTNRFEPKPSWTGFVSLTGGSASPGPVRTGSPLSRPPSPAGSPPCPSPTPQCPGH
jgi:hypothetical protein